MIKFEFWLAQTHGGEWHVLDKNEKIIFKTMSQDDAMKELDRLMGTPDWRHITVKDDSGTTIASDMIEKHKVRMH